MLRKRIVVPERFILALEKTASALTRIADRFDADAKEFKDMVEGGKGLRPSEVNPPEEERHS